MASSTRIGDSKTCNCDVIVLSYKEECQDEKPSHISYVFANESTWTTGRNLLYFVAIGRLHHYHYYIFLDDDVDLGFNSFSSQEIKRLTPFRAFEEWLLDDEPAVGVANFGNGKELLKRRRLTCGISDSQVVLPVVWFDARFNAFQRQSIKHILPFPTKYDKQSWWSSQLHVIYSAELIFRGQALENVAITVSNGKHRPYPRGRGGHLTPGPVIIDDIQNKAPKAYQNRTLFKTLKTDQKRYSMNTTTYCMNTTHRHPIVPYSHFQGQS